MRWLTALTIACAGCANVFDLDRVHVTDAGVAPDGDAIVASECPASFGSSRYLFVTMELDWLGAQAHCRSLDPIPDDDVFVHLAVMTTLSETIAIQLPFDARAWVGLSDIKEPVPPPYNYVWLTDEEPGDIPWGASEPDANSNRPAGEIRQGMGGIYDTHSGDIKPFVCECDSWPVVESKFL